ncbi:MAG: FtsX-like permease family protein [Caldithrix sp.]|nr:FtsX-like permease family protein [Caldithrix sp.]
MKKVLTKSSLAYLLRHPWQVGLSILGIAIGVGVVISIDIANESARKAFRQSMQTVAGASTHHIVGSAKGVPDSVYFQLRKKNPLRKSAPVIEGTVRLNNDRSSTFTVLGIDPFAERPFRSYFDAVRFTADSDLGTFISHPLSIVISEYSASRMGFTQGDTLLLQTGSKTLNAKLIGLMMPSGTHQLYTGQNMILTDIGSAQMLFDMQGYVSRIDLILNENKSGLPTPDVLQARLPQNVRVIRSESRTQTAEQMVQAFQINLTALSLLALIVGMFLIYNTMTFSVVQRKIYLGLLRATGVTRLEIFRLIIQEAFLLGLIGTTLGIGLGILLGRGMVQLISQTINDLYFVLQVRSVDISWFTLLKGLLLGTAATVISTLKPAREATTEAISVTLKRSAQESKLKNKIPMLTTAGLILLVGGVILLAFSQKTIAVSYGGILALILGFSLLTPLTIIVFVRILNPLSKRLIGLLGRMASQSIELQMSRTAVAIAALSLAVSATIGVSTMIGSFRNTVVQWLEDRIKADVYISAPSQVARRNDATIPAALLDTLKQLPQVNRLNFYRETQIIFKNTIINVVGVGLNRRDFQTFTFKSGQPENIWPDFRRGQGVIVTEPYAYKHNIRVNDRIELPTKSGIKTFEVLGIYYDYGTDLGLVSMAHKSFVHHFGATRLSGISVFVNTDTDARAFANMLPNILPGGNELMIRTNRYLREMSIDIFDRTFIIANVLQILAMIVAFIGIFSALMALQMERNRELGVLRANGLTPGQLWGLTNMQTGLMGLVAGILAMPLGFILAWVLIYVINKRSFGWTLQMDVNMLIFIQAAVLAVVAALLAGIYPAYKMARTSPALALREE